MFYCPECGKRRLTMPRTATPEFCSRCGKRFGDGDPRMTEEAVQRHLYGHPTSAFGRDRAARPADERR